MSSVEHSLEVKTRTEFGKGAARRLRNEELVPGVYYDASGVNIPVTVAELPMRKLYEKAGSTHVFNLVVDNNGATETKPALVWRIEHHPYKTKLVHVDFYGVDLTKEIKVSVRVEIIGKAVGVVKGGKLELYREHVEIICLPLAIPDKVVIDVTPLDINQHVNIKNLVLPEGVKAVFDNNYSVVGVEMKVKEEAAEASA